MASLVVERCDPRDRSDEIVALFSRHGQTEFAHIFDRVYRRLADDGLCSWIGLEDGRVVMHISVSRVPVRNGQERRLVGVLGDLMVDEARRDFWAPLQLVRTMVSDLEADGQVDFLLTTTIADAASLFHAAGFRPLGRLRRYVLPLREPYLMLARLLAGAGAKPAVAWPLNDDHLKTALPRLHSGGYWRPEPSEAFYEVRIPRHEYQDGTWIGVGADGGAEPVGWALVSRHGTWRELGLADAFWSEEPGRLGEVLHAAARWGRANGFPQLAVSTLESDGVASAIKGAGFIPRAVRSAVLARPLGASVVPPAAEWFFSALLASVW